ncbi:hypothetical protein [Halpernia frigidisoli]|uniref:Lipoprotein n=1 Tax=Halpernia frigidisoli TaxID=1125876 RepID=A0A1I3HWX4_9FLAO|nr:hypothetical protein [Halpernia frigidisoli]SFI40070.1 hypothetical protein SAMN05443292_2429 [Halpernia frigidisoli]
MKLKTPLLLIIILSLLSCQQIANNYYENHKNDSYISPYKGSYVGSFSGDDNGNLKVEISSKDGVTITKHSNVSNTDDIFIDTLNGSLLSGTASPNSGFRLLGNLVSQNTTFSGNWVQNNFKGTWTIKKL